MCCTLFGQRLGKDDAAIVGIRPGDVSDAAKTKALIPLAKVGGSFRGVEREFGGSEFKSLLFDKLKQAKPDTASLELWTNCKLAE